VSCRHVAKLISGDTHGRQGGEALDLKRLSIAPACVALPSSGNHRKELTRFARKTPHRPLHGPAPAADASQTPSRNAVP
jgi:hypothetical protein